MTIHEYLELLEQLHNEAQQRLNQLDHQDQAAIENFQTELLQQRLAVGRQHEPQVQIIPTAGGGFRLELGY